MVGGGNAVAIVQLNSRQELDPQRVALGSDNRSDRLARGFGRLPIGQVRRAAVQEIVGAATVEGLRGVGRERIGIDMAALRRIERVDTLPIVGGEVGDIVRILEPPLDFEGGNACLDQLLQIGGAVHVLQREQVTLMDGLPLRVGQLAAVGIEQVVLHAAHLGAAAPIGTAAENDFAQIAAARIGHAQCAMHKGLKLDRRLVVLGGVGEDGLMDGSDFCDP